MTCGLLLLEGEGEEEKEEEEEDREEDLEEDLEDGDRDRGVLRRQNRLLSRLWAARERSSGDDTPSGQEEIRDSTLM